MDKTLGQIAYEAFWSDKDEPTPWRDMCANTQYRWEAAARAVDVTKAAPVPKLRMMLESLRSISPEYFEVDATSELAPTLMYFAEKHGGGYRVVITWFNEETKKMGSNALERQIGYRITK